MFTPVEGDTDAPVAIVDAALAARVWPGLDPIGRRISDSSGADRTVIGVVPHLRWRLTTDTAQTLYVPLDPKAPQLGGVVSLPRASFAEAEETVARAGRAASGGGVVSVYPLDDSITLRDAGESRFQGPIVAVLGAVAFLLTGIGLYGLVTYLVEQRIREYGIRLALGARPGDLWGTVLRQSVAPALVGIGAGLAISLWTNRLLASLLFGVTPTSPGVLALVAASLMAAAVLASVRPARRVLQIDPVRVLRAE
jgi:hypothetical protein